MSSSLSASNAVFQSSNILPQPESSTLHIHPLTEQSSELGDQVSVISSTKQAKGGGLTHQLSDVSRFASTGWHADITFERVPSDYAMLKIHTLPETGGDTLWASGNEIYERLSPKMKEMLEGLTATHDASFFHDEARRLGQDIREDMRGSPLNIGKELSAVHPVVRTNRMLPISLLLLLPFSLSNQLDSSYIVQQLTYSSCNRQKISFH